MASYFDLPPQPTAPAGALQVSEEHDDQYKGSSFLSPQVSRILDDLDFDDASSSDEEDDDQDEQDDKPAPTTAPNKTTTKSQHDTRRSRLGSVSLVPDDFPPTPPAAAESGSRETKASPARGSSSPGKEKASKPRHANMERFKSLRSVLFLSKIEDNMNKMRSEEQIHNDAALDWKAQHDKRQGLNRPTTPDKEKKTESATAKEGLTTRVATKIRRMTSHSTPTMEKIPESAATTHETAPTRRDSTATDTDDDDTTNLTHHSNAPRSPHTNNYDSDISHSDEDLVRWVSRADPPSGSEASLPASSAASPSLAPADIPNLVQHASRLSIPTVPAVQFYADGTGHGDSDASTASDSEGDADAVASEDEDADELVRWVSRRDGALAGPVRRGTPSPTQNTHLGGTAAVDEDVPELGSWTTKARAKQDMHVSERGRTAERSGSRDRETKTKTRAKTGLRDEDVDELVRWVSRRDSKAGGEEEVRGRGVVV
jgi:hypothetical protein